MDWSEIAKYYVGLIRIRQILELFKIGLVLIRQILYGIGWNLLAIRWRKQLGLKGELSPLGIPNHHQEFNGMQRHKTC